MYIIHKYFGEADASKKQHAFILFYWEGNLLASGILHETSPPQRSNDDVDTNDNNTISFSFYTQYNLK